MAQMLPDGTIVPSYLGTSPMGVGTSNDSFGNLVFRQGEIREIIYPNDPRSASKTVVEYSVAVQVRDGTGPAAVVNYPNCQVANLFGGIADKLRYTLRAQSKPPAKGEVVSDGSKVTLLCVNGEVRRALIVGGINEDPTQEEKTDGHNLQFEFNGLGVGINDDGELRIRFRGKTQADGTLDSNANAQAEGSYLILDKEGSIKLHTAGEAQYIHIDHKNRKINVLADQEWRVTSNSKISFVSKDSFNVVTNTSCSIEADDRVYIDSRGVWVGAANESWVLGDTWRRNESQMHTQMSSTLDMIGATIGVAAANLQVAARLHKIPVMGAVLGSVPLQLAATAIGSLAPMFNTLAGAIKAYEGAGPYLSTKNKGD